VLHCDLLVTGGVVMTLDEAGTILADGAVAIAGNAILEVGPSAELAARYAPARRIDAKDRLVLPGFVNVHNHSPLMITRGMVEDLGFAPMYVPNIPQGHRLSSEEAFLLARLGVYEMLRQGSTTIVDYYRFPEALAAAHAELGTRAVIGGRIHDVDPEALAQGRHDYATQIGRASIAENADLIARWDGHGGRIRCDWAPHAPDTCSDALLKEVAALAEAHGGNVHTHLAQSRGEVRVVRERTGKGPAQALAEAGLLHDRTIAAHCIHLDAEDIALCGQARMTVAHSPIGNAKAGDIAPILALRDAGARIALCTDTMSGDMVEAMRWAVSMQRVREGGRFVLDAATALRWATRAGAEAIGMGAEIGALEAGRKADLILLDTTAPTMAPVVDGAGIVVWSASGHDVDTAIVDGRVVLEGGLPTLADGPEIVREAQKVAEGLWTRAGRRPITLAP
jgi:5-methylthioadenosine/S-adenosylhomocysteine deaminase